MEDRERERESACSSERDSEKERYTHKNVERYKIYTARHSATHTAKNAVTILRNIYRNTLNVYLERDPIMTRHIGTHNTLQQSLQRTLQTPFAALCNTLCNSLCNTLQHAACGPAARTNYAAAHRRTPHSATHSADHTTPAIYCMRTWGEAQY